LEELEKASALFSGISGTKPYDWAVATRNSLELDFMKIQYRLADEYGARGCKEGHRALERALACDPCDRRPLCAL
jgi:DNA-binding SARP family transcriptional activator